MGHRKRLNPSLHLSPPPSPQPHPHPIPRSRGEGADIGVTVLTAASNKLVLWNQALINALAPRSFEDARADAGWWGRLVENAVGGHLLNHLPAPEWGVTYWRRGNAEVDFVVERGRAVWALEVKSGRPRPASGLSGFRSAYPKTHTLIIGSDGIPLEEFLGSDPRPLLEGAA